jgi:hypothetical protein
VNFLFCDLLKLTFVLSYYVSNAILLFLSGQDEEPVIEKLERNFCLSASKLALGLALLGLLLLLAVGVALFSATAGRRRSYVRVIY